MVKRCYVSNCPTGRKSCKEKPSIFKAPNDERLLQKWRQNVPSNGRLLTSTDHICEKHFEPQCIVPRFQLIKGDYYQDCIRTKLTGNAVPTIFPKAVKIPVSHNLNNSKQIVPKTSLDAKTVKKLTVASPKKLVTMATLIEKEISNGIEVKESDYIPICFKCLIGNCSLHAITLE